MINAKQDKIEQESVSHTYYYYNSDKYSSYLELWYIYF